MINITIIDQLDQIKEINNIIDEQRAKEAATLKAKDAQIFQLQNVIRELKSHRIDNTDRIQKEKEIEIIR